MEFDGELGYMAGEICESLTGMLGEASGGTRVADEALTAWIAAVFADTNLSSHPEPLPAMGGVDWGILAPRFSPFLLPKRLCFFLDGAFFSHPTGNTAGDSTAISVF